MLAGQNLKPNGQSMKSTILLAILAVFVTEYPMEVRAQSQKKATIAYVGGSSCALCHSKVAESFKKHNKKKTIQLKPDCGKCHLIHAHEG